MMLLSSRTEYTVGLRHATVLMVVTILATLLRLVLRFNIAHAAGYDDGLAFLGLVSRTPVLHEVFAR
jgi:hypothetical protein